MPSLKKAAKPAPKKRQATAKAPTPWQKWSAKTGAIDELCLHVISGGHAAEFCKARDINYPTLLHWINADQGRIELYARAREDRADKLADEIVAISDESEVTARYDGEEVRLVLDAAAVARNRLRVDARKWVASKLKPRTYGEKLDVTQEVTIKKIPDAQLDAEIAKLMAKAGLNGADAGGAA